MEKQEVLAALAELKKNGEISKSEILAVISDGDKEASFSEVSDSSKHITIADILYYIGGGIVFLGISVMVYSGWMTLGDLGRLAVTLGSALVFYSIGVFLNNAKKFGDVATAFFLISALVFPIGFFVLFSNAGMEASTPLVNILISLILFIIFLVSYLSYRRNILMVFCIAFGSWFYFALVTQIFTNSSLNFQIYQYFIMALGVCYIFLGQYFANKPTLAFLQGWLYSLGSIAILGAAIGLPSIFWTIIYPALVAGIIFLSIKTKNRTFLVWGSLFLISYIMKLTGQYFSQGFGWPIALTVAGLLLIAVGYFSFYINKKYLDKTSS
jgi:hypothetical protein